MPRKLALLLRWTCLVLAGVVGWQVYAIVSEPEPLDRLGDLNVDVPDTPTSPESAANEQKAADAASPPFPPLFEVIATSGILGKAPEKKPPPPALVGVLGRYALIRAPGGQEDLVSEGGELGGVKVIKISTNRVLIEHEGQVKELTVYSGMGSPTLVSPKKDATSGDAASAGKAKAEATSDSEKPGDSKESSDSEKPGDSQGKEQK